MAIATGVAKQIRVKAESTWGTAPGASGAQLLRRVSSNLDLKKATYESAEIRADYQVSDFRHGVRSVDGTISGEPSPGTYQMFLDAACRRASTAVTAITSLSLTIAASGSNYTVTRSAGDFLTGGIRAGMVVAITAGSVNANTLNARLLVISATSTVLTVSPLNGATLTAEGPIASCTLTVPGKYTYVPTSGHTDPSFSIEHWFSDISKSELFTGCKVNTVGLQLPPSGIAKVDFGFMGKDITTATSAYYTSPTAATTSGVLAAVNGIVSIGGTRVATLTGLTININGGMTADAVVGSNTYPDIFEGRVRVSGQFTAYFEDTTLRDLFINETEAELLAVFSTSNDKTAEFMSFALPRIKTGGASKDDGEKGIVQTIPFTALIPATGGSGYDNEQTTLMIHDSLAA